jgi:hypothetical protein
VAEAAGEGEPFLLSPRVQRRGPNSKFCLGPVRWVAALLGPAEGASKAAATVLDLDPCKDRARTARARGFPQPVTRAVCFLCWRGEYIMLVRDSPSPWRCLQTFTAWVNSHLRKVNENAKDLRTDLRCGG